MKKAILILVAIFIIGCKTSSGGGYRLNYHYIYDSSGKVEYIVWDSGKITDASGKPVGEVKK